MRRQWQSVGSFMPYRRPTGRRAVALLALVLQLFSAGYLQTAHAARPIGSPCPVHAGMVLNGEPRHHPTQPASPADNCPSCGAACFCSATALAVPVEWRAPARVPGLASRLTVITVQQTRTLQRYPSDAPARAPPLGLA